MHTRMHIMFRNTSCKTLQQHVRARHVCGTRPAPCGAAQQLARFEPPGHHLITASSVPRSPHEHINAASQFHLLRRLMELVIFAQDVEWAARRGGLRLLALAPKVVHLVHLSSHNGRRR